MEQQLRSEVLRRLQDQYGLKPRAGTQYLRQGTCPSCGKKELYSRQDEPWFIKCGRESKCGEQWHVKELFDDLFDDYSKRYPTTQEAPRAGAFPFESLKALAKQRTDEGKKLPTLVWGLDNEPGAHRFTRKHAAMARELGFSCEAAQIPQRGRKVDWNDLHQRWAFIDDAVKRLDQVERDTAPATSLPTTRQKASPFGSPTPTTLTPSSGVRSISSLEKT